MNRSKVIEKVLLSNVLLLYETLNTIYELYLSENVTIDYR